jgi:hypothetical protein
VRRALLVLAMLFSLWPVGVIAVAATNGSSNKTEQSSSSGSSPSAPQADDAGLKALQGQEDQLLQRLHNSRSLHGTADAALAEAAGQLARSYESWESENGGLDTKADKVEGLEATIAQRVATFARHPSQARLDAFNRAVADYNAGAR